MRSWGFCKDKKIPKIREKLGNGWVGQAPNRISFFFENIVFFVCFFCCTCFQKKKKFHRRVGGCCLDNPSFSRIFGKKIDETPCLGSILHIAGKINTYF